MKKIISILSFLLISSVAIADAAAPVAKAQSNVKKSEELSWVDEQIKAIIPARKGISSEYIDSVTQPFIFVVVSQKGKPGTLSGTAGVRVFKKSVSRSLSVTLIINSKAFISGRWYGINDRVQGYKIASIGENTVTLVKNKRTKILSIKRDNKRIKINTK